jgi:hypothetical protein
MRGQYAVPLRVARGVDAEARQHQAAQPKPAPPPGLPPSVAAELAASSQLLTEIDSILERGGAADDADERGEPARRGGGGGAHVKHFLDSVGDDASMQQPSALPRHSSASSVGFLEHFDLDALLADESSLLQAQLECEDDDEWADEADYDYFDGLFFSVLSFA